MSFTTEVSRNPNVARLAKVSPALAEKITSQGGYLLQPDIAEIAQIERLMLVLVRCGNGRFLCPAQDVEHFCGILHRENSDYVRDVSIPAHVAS